jgi:hypothetical protein
MKIFNTLFAVSALSAMGKAFELDFYLGDQCTDEELGVSIINVTEADPNPCMTFSDEAQAVVIIPNSTEQSGSKSKLL